MARFRSAAVAAPPPGSLKVELPGWSPQRPENAGLIGLAAVYRAVAVTVTSVREGYRVPRLAVPPASTHGSGLSRSRSSTAGASAPAAHPSTSYRPDR